jgi:c-di-GMP-related signal transduction protein
MTETAAQTWLSSHHDIIPALEVNHRRALEILENHTRTLRDLAEVIVLDPGMSVSLYHEVNARRRNEEQAVDSVHAALALMGDSAIADLVMQHRVLDETHPDAVRRQSYHQLMSRSYHLLAQSSDQRDPQRGPVAQRRRVLRLPVRSRPLPALPGGISRIR